MQKQIWKMGILKKECVNRSGISWQFSKKKFFFVNFHEISRYRKILKRDFRPVGIEIRWFWIAQIKDWKICFSMKKKFGGRNRVKFHFDDFCQFSERKKRVFLRLSWVIMFINLFIAVHTGVSKLPFDVFFT